MPASVRSIFRVTPLLTYRRDEALNLHEGGASPAVGPASPVIREDGNRHEGSGVIAIGELAKARHSASCLLVE